MQLLLNDTAPLAAFDEEAESDTRFSHKRDSAYEPEEADSSIDLDVYELAFAAILGRIRGSSKRP